MKYSKALNFGEILISTELDDSNNLQLKDDEHKYTNIELSDDSLEIHEDLPEIHEYSLDEKEECKSDIDISMSDVPGADNALEIEDEEEEDVLSNDSQSAETDYKKSTSKKWDWSDLNSDEFINWVKERLKDIPKHSGMDIAGLERASSYLQKLNSEILKAMRSDLDGELDADTIEVLRSKIDDGVSKLEKRIDKINKKKKASDEDHKIVKNAYKHPGIHGIYITVPLLISRIARVCINGMVSGGHDIGDLFIKLSKKYDLSDREKAETFQLIQDMGYDIHTDRGFFPDEKINTEEDNFDWSARYRS